MNYEEFLAYMRKNIRESLDENTQVEIRRVVKNNAVALDGVLILEPGHRIAPTIYLNSFYEEYRAGKSLSGILSEVLDTYRKNRVEQNPELSFFSSFSEISGKIALRLVNYERNREQLRDLPHRRFLDLAAVCYYAFEHEAFGSGTIQICRSHLDVWEVSEKELLENATENTLKLFSWSLQSMEELLREFGVHSAAGPEIPMYVLTNRARRLGAAVILYDEVLRSVGEILGSDFFILPSSIHECIVVPAGIGFAREELSAMVREINREHVAPEEVLSGSAYYYSRKTHEVTV